MRYTFLIAMLLLLHSCRSPLLALRKNHSPGNFEQVSNNSKEQVWDNIVDFFSRNGLSIKLIDKSSGLIVSDQTRLKWSLEKSDGTLYDSTAWVAVPKVKFGGVGIPPATVVGEWNIRIKEASPSSTRIAVNLVNIRYNTAEQPFYMPYTNNLPQTTGRFERMIYDKVK